MTTPLREGGGLLLVDKPAGVTSYAIVGGVRRTLVRAFPDLAPRRRGRAGPRPPRFKCGHAGTLDPLATGLLVVLVGRASRLSRFLLGLDKLYAATVRFGVATDSLDADGAVTGTAPVPADPEAVLGVLDGFRGVHAQVPPVFSALKRDGQPLYRRARAGEDVAAPAARPVTIHRLEATGVRWGAEPAIDLLVGCGSGTYIRSLARDIAAAAGTVGHLEALRRLAVGPFVVEDACSGVRDLDGAALAARVQPMATALPGVPRLVLDSDETAHVRLGRQPDPDWLERLDAPPARLGRSGPLFAMVDADGRLVAVGSVDAATGEPRIALGIPAGE